MAELETVKQELRERREDAMDDLRSALDGKLEVIQDAFEAAHVNYLDRTDKRVGDFKHYTKVRQAQAALPPSVRLSATEYSRHARFPHLSTHTHS